MLGRNVVHRPNVFIEAGTPVADSRLQEELPDTRIIADPSEHVESVGVHGVAEIRNFVCKRNFQRQICIREALDQFGFARRRSDERLIEVCEEREERICFVNRIRADDNPIGVEEVVQRRTFAQELGSVNDGGDAAQPVGDKIRRPNRDRRPNDERLPGEVDIEQGVDCRIEVAQIRRPIGSRRRANSDDDELGVGCRFDERLHEAQVAGSQVFLKGRREAILVIGCDPVLQSADTLANDIVADHIVAELGKADGASHPDVSGTDDAKTTRDERFCRFERDELRHVIKHLSW